MKPSLAILILTAICCGCGPSSGPIRQFGRDMAGEQKSPSGDFVLKTVSHWVDYDGNSNKWWHARFQVYDAEGQLVFDETNDFATWFTLEASWVSSNEVHIHSGDVGDFVIKPVDGRWVRVRQGE